MADPVYKRLAELYPKIESNTLTEAEQKEVKICLKANYHKIQRLLKYEALHELWMNLGQEDLAKEAHQMIRRELGLV